MSPIQVLVATSVRAVLALCAPSSSVSPVITPHVLSELTGASSSVWHHPWHIHKPLGTAEASRRLRSNKNLLFSVLSRLSDIVHLSDSPPMIAGLSREGQAQKGSFSATAGVLAVQHYKVFAEHELQTQNIPKASC